MSEDADYRDMPPEQRAQLILSGLQVKVREVLEKTGFARRYQKYLKEIGFEGQVTFEAQFLEEKKPEEVPAEVAEFIERMTAAANLAIIESPGVRSIHEAARAAGYQITFGAKASVTRLPPAVTTQLRLSFKEPILTDEDLADFARMFHFDAETGKGFGPPSQPTK